MKIRKSWFRTEIEIEPSELQNFYNVCSLEISERIVRAILSIVEKLV